MTEEQQMQNAEGDTPMELAHGKGSELTDEVLDSVSAGAPGQTAPIPIPYPLAKPSTQLG